MWRHRIEHVLDENPWFQQQSRWSLARGVGLAVSANIG